MQRVGNSTCASVQRWPICRNQIQSTFSWTWCRVQNGCTFLFHAFRNWLHLSVTFSKQSTPKKSCLANHPISVWRPEHDDTSNYFMQAIVDEVKLATPNPFKCLYLFTDPSNDFWAGSMTQVPTTEIEISTDSPQEYNHAPVAFVSSACRGFVALFCTRKRMICGCEQYHTTFTHPCSLRRIYHLHEP